MKVKKSIVYYMLVFSILLILPACNMGFTRNAGASVTQPVVKGNPTPTSITVYDVSITGSRGRQSAEYAIRLAGDTASESLRWQNSTTFTGLSPAATYYVYARAAGNFRNYAGEYSVSAPIRFYTVVFQPGRATSGTPPETQAAFQNEITVLPGRGSLEHYGFVFGGWNTQANGRGAAFLAGHRYRLNGNEVLYAMWVPAIPPINDVPVFRFVFQPPVNNVPIVSGITISRTGRDDYPTTGTLIISNPEDYTLIEWFYGDIKLAEGDSLVLDASDIRYNMVGTHNITVVAWQNNVPFSLRVLFLVVE